MTDLDVPPPAEVKVQTQNVLVDSGAITSEDKKPEPVKLRTDVPLFAY
jgi:hypothetical protein